jgi:MscS family membrane protein
MPVFLAIILLTFSLQAQAPAQIKDPMGRNDPQDSVFQFLEACHARNYSKALHYLDLRNMSPAERAKEGPELARQLEDLLDDTPFDIGTLSRDPQGDQSDGLSANLEHLLSVRVGKDDLDLQLQRIDLKPGFSVWLVSADSVQMIPTAHKAVAENPFESKLPQPLVTFEIMETPVWRWIALIIAAPVLWFLAGLLATGILAIARPVLDAPAFRRPLQVCLFSSGLLAFMRLAPPASLPRLFVERTLGLMFFLGIAWAGAVAVDLLMERWQSSLDPRTQAVRYSVLPLGRQVLKLSIFLIAVLSVFSAWGYNISTILAGLGVGGLAVALAAQKTIENLFGGLSVIGDRPVLVGDACRFGDRTGEVMHIGLRSTRIRTPDRTIISVPNGQFSAMALENISGRDKMLFQTKLNLRRDTTSDQLSQVLSSIHEILKGHDKIEAGAIPVRFVGVGAYSLDIEVVVYVTTPAGSADEDVAGGRKRGGGAGGSAPGSIRASARSDFLRNK